MSAVPGAVRIAPARFRPIVVASTPIAAIYLAPEKFCDALAAFVYAEAAIKREDYAGWHHHKLEV